jgi:para-nitrobenzyl esterase
MIMTPSTAFKVFYLSAMAFGGITTTAHASASVNLPDGAMVQGISNGNVDSFLGIQYGEVGQRFSRSTLRVPSEAEVVNATSYGPNCHQTYIGVPEWVHQVREEDEECLYLNIWRPANATGLLSTMFWIHGGGFAIGSGSEPVNEGIVLAREQNVIVVSINYRLGVLGFLPQDQTGFGGMNGLRDQIVALEWVNQHISSFGGDPDDVTIFGESAGGEAVCMLSVSPLAKGLFHRAIQQSGECVNNYWVFGIPNEDVDFGLDMVDQLLNASGATSIEDLADSDKFPAVELQSVTSVQLGWPVIILDQEVLPEHPRVLYQSAENVVPTDIMVGSNSYEDVMFFGATPEMYEGMASGMEEWVHGVAGSVFGDNVAQDLINAYSPAKYYDDQAVQAFAQFNGDYYIRCPVREFASIAADVVAGDVYLFNFAHFSSSTDPLVHFGFDESIVGDTTSWASHMAEIPFVFGTLESWIVPETNKPATQADYALSAEMRSRWANFAKTGKPSSDDSAGTQWNSVSKEAMKDGAAAVRVLVFEAGSSEMGTLPEKSEQCAAFPFTTSSGTEGDDDSSGTKAHNWAAALSIALLMTSISALLI